MSKMRRCQALGVLAVTALSVAGCSSGSKDGGISVIGQGGGTAAGPGIGFGGSVVGFGGSNGTGTSGSGGGAGTTVTKECASTKASSMDTLTVRPADIVIAVDSSGSMKTEIGFVQDNLNRFSQQIVAAGIDARVILIGKASSICIAAPLGSGSCPNDTNLPNYIHVEREVGSNDALNVIVDSFPTWRQHLRPEATKSFFVVTDDDATEAPLNSSSAFRQAIDALDPTLFRDWTMNGVYCFTMCQGSNGAELAAAVGSVYKVLVAETRGVEGDLCLQDFNPVFDRLAMKIVQGSSSQIACEWSFPTPPAGQTLAPELVEVRRTTSSGTSALLRVSSSAECADQKAAWYFDNPRSPTKILACPSTCTALQGQPGGIDVVFACELLAGCAATSSTSIGGPGGQVACKWPLPAPPTGQSLDTASVNVRLRNSSGVATTVGKVASANECASAMGGWHYDDATKPSTMELCPETCSLAQASGATIDVLFGCKSIDQVPR